jgi:hypothetical protein
VAIRKERIQASVSLIIYAPPECCSAEGFDRILDQFAAEGQCIMFGALDDLTQRLRQPMDPDLIAVLFPKDNIELRALVSIRHLLRDLRVVLILPDSHESTVSRGHVLRPRFVSYADGDLSDVAAVVNKMKGIQRTCVGLSTG